MTKTKDEKPDTRSQRQKFIDAATKFGAEMEDGAFRKAVKKVATAPAKEKKIPVTKKG